MLSGTQKTGDRVDRRIECVEVVVQASQLEDLLAGLGEVADLEVPTMLPQLVTQIEQRCQPGAVERLGTIHLSDHADSPLRDRLFQSTHQIASGFLVEFLRRVSDQNSTESFRGDGHDV